MNGWRSAAVMAGMLDGEGRGGGRQQREHTYDARSSRDGEAEDAEVPGQAGSRGRGGARDAEAPKTTCRGTGDFSPVRAVRGCLILVAVRRRRGRWGCGSAPVGRASGCVSV
jgi:hypothetical protein